MIIFQSLLWQLAALEGAEAESGLSEGWARSGGGDEPGDGGGGAGAAPDAGGVADGPPEAAGAQKTSRGEGGSGEGHSAGGGDSKRNRGPWCLPAACMDTPSASLAVRWVAREASGVLSVLAAPRPSHTTSRGSLCFVSFALVPTLASAALARAAAARGGGGEGGASAAVTLLLDGIDAFDQW